MFYNTNEYVSTKHIIYKKKEKKTAEEVMREKKHRNTHMYVCDSK